MDTPNSLSSFDIPVARIPSSSDVDDLLGFGGQAAAATAATTAAEEDAAMTGNLEIEAPVVSNPLSGDESWEASSPESLSPNAPIDNNNDDDDAVAKTTMGLIDVDSPDLESGFAELSAASNVQLPLVDGTIAAKDYRAIVEMSSGEQ